MIIIEGITIRFATGQLAEVNAIAGVEYSDTYVTALESAIVTDVQGIVLDANEDDSDEDETDNLIAANNELDADGNYDDTGI